MNLYIDESGSIDIKKNNFNKYFIISVLMTNDKDKLKTIYKRFVSKNMNKLKQLDEDFKMFSKDGSFTELKGSCFDRELKNEFLDYFCRNNLLQVRYIILNNDNLEEKFTKNKARTFNYSMKIFLLNSIHMKMITNTQLYLQIDERNIKTDSKFSLEDYLNQELVLDLNLIEDIKVDYFNSENNALIQISDVFANIKYSNLKTKGKYSAKLHQLEKEGYILKDFKFPKAFIPPKVLKNKI
ncbi:MAG: DUF3800 domain-containing protein [Oscillospiraceae bacterium]|nr:DUF3800 domain-containing protein [Oscillospiraceae bacterium]